MKKRNYTREIMSELRDAGRIAVRSVGSPEPVRYAPRSQRDPMPWTDGAFRYTGREVHTVRACGKTLLNISAGRVVLCGKPTGHDKACAPKKTGYEVR